MLAVWGVVVGGEWKGGVELLTVAGVHDDVPAGGLCLYLYAYLSMLKPLARSTASAASAQPLKSSNVQAAKLQGMACLQAGQRMAQAAGAAHEQGQDVRWMDGCRPACQRSSMQLGRSKAKVQRSSRGAFAGQLHQVGNKAVLSGQPGLACGGAGQVGWPISGCWGSDWQRD